MKPPIAVPAPSDLTGKEFEKRLLKSAETYDKVGVLHMNRYGVSASLFGGKWNAIPSLPDFEGAYSPYGQQFNLEAKVVSDHPGLQISADELFVKKRQITHMLSKVRMGVKCFVVIHFNRRELVRSTREAQTWAFPIRYDPITGLPDAVWDPLLKPKENLDPTYLYAEEMPAWGALPVQWTLSPRALKPVPAFHSILQ